MSSRRKWASHEPQTRTEGVPLMNLLVEKSERKQVIALSNFLVKLLYIFLKFTAEHTENAEAPESPSTD
ncbi:hypothetical protein C5S32_00335 [ANME-1 cluster archaeon GoMg1]|nr:hypothetical protein [ANME-1 cluster archaeon GoMg1]